MSRGLEDTTFLGNLFSGAFFKRNQGRLVRRLTAIAVAVVVAFGCWSFAAWMENSTVTEGLSPLVQTTVPIVVALIGFWLAFRIVNYPPFANFLISVEAEMDKVSWADWPYLKRATAVVLCTMVFLGVVLAVYDLIWFKLFTLIGILDASPLDETVPPGG
jgi:preprotein translocase subunit SecE